jgi:hypothetical protein
MTIDLQILTQELQDPVYAPYIPNSTGTIADMLNKQGAATKIVSRPIGIGTILDTLGPTIGAQLLDTLESIKTQVRSVYWAFYLLEKGDLDIGLASTRAAIDGLVQAQIMTEEVATLLKNLANAPASRAEVLFGAKATVTEQDIIQALGV